MTHPRHRSTCPPPRPKGSPARLRLARLAPCRLAVAAVAIVAAAPLPASAQDSPTATLKLIELLIQNGTLSREAAGTLLAQAQAEARELEAARRASRTAARQPGPRVAAPAAAVAATAAAIPPPELQPGAVRVTYVPETVRKQIRDEVKTELVAEANRQGWGPANALPDWARRYTFFGDLQARAELIQNDGGNLSAFPDWNTINRGPGFNENGVDNAPLRNVTEDRSRFRLRARFGFNAKVADGVDATFRIGTGNDNSPVSTNQTLGSNSGFGKYDLWLDQAYLRFTPAEWLTLNLGRAPNPFELTDLQFDEDLNFDGVSAEARAALPLNTEGRVIAGVFPVYNTEFNFAVNNADKFESRDKYLAAVQAVGRWRLGSETGLRFGAGYFRYINIEGSRSSACDANTTSVQCDTDISRPLFVQSGNTLTPIRSISPLPDDDPEYQYYGLASKFGILSLMARLDLDRVGGFPVSLEGDYVKNLSYDRSRIEALGPVNNLSASRDASGEIVEGAYEGGDTGWMLRAVVGAREIVEPRQWNVSLAYKYLESDAVLDAFAESEFHGGGTNAQGFILAGRYGLFRNVSMGARWFSANEVSGPKYQNDVFQVDLAARF